MESKTASRLKKISTVILILAILWASALKTEASFSDLITGFPEMGKLVKDMMPPDLSYLPKIIDPMAETIRMAIIGTTFGAILAIPFSLIAAKNIFRIPILNTIVRFIMGLIRTIPDLLFASVFVAVFGIGPLAGIFALTFFSFGLISKLTYESIETIDPGPLEAMTAVGANKVQWIHLGVIPQVLPQFIGYLLYTLEINIRAAAVLGLVGAGGIGLYIDRTLGLFKYRQTSTIILVTLIFVIAIDILSAKVREKLI